MHVLTQYMLAVCCCSLTQSEETHDAAQSLLTICLQCETLAWKLTCCDIHDCLCSLSLDAPCALMLLKLGLRDREVKANCTADILMQSSRWHINTHNNRRTMQFHAKHVTAKYSVWRHDGSASFGWLHQAFIFVFVAALSTSLNACCRRLW